MLVLITSINNIRVDPNDISKDANGVIIINAAKDLNHSIKLVSTANKCDTNCNNSVD